MNLTGWVIDNAGIYICFIFKNLHLQASLIFCFISQTNKFLQFFYKIGFLKLSFLLIFCHYSKNSNKREGSRLGLSPLPSTTLCTPMVNFTFQGEGGGGGGERVRINGYIFHPPHHGEGGGMDLPMSWQGHRCMQDLVCYILLYHFLDIQIILEYEKKHLQCIYNQNRTRYFLFLSL